MRIQGKSLFLTYPKCEMALEVVLSSLQSALYFKRIDIVDYIIAEEEHKDGTPHIHAWISLSRKVNLKDPRVLDIKGHHGNYQSARSNSNVVAYVTKGSKFISSKPLDELKLQVKAKKEHTSMAYQLALKEGLTKELVQEFPQILPNLQKIQAGLTIYNGLPNREEEKEQITCSWYADQDLSQKQRHYWVSGKVNTGKSTWWRNLKASGVRLFEGVYNNDWLGFDRRSYDGIVFDCFKG